MTDNTVYVEELPGSVEVFVALRDRLASSPKGGAATMVVALLLYTEDEALGRACLTVAIDRERLTEGSDGYKGLQLNRSDLQFIYGQLQDKRYIVRSYVQGTSPENHYRLPEPPYPIAFGSNPYGGDPDSGRYKPRFRTLTVE